MEPQAANLLLVDQEGGGSGSEQELAQDLAVGPEWEEGLCQVPLQSQVQGPLVEEQGHQLF